MFEVVESPGGLYIGARRNAEDGQYYWRITQWVMPSFTMIAPRGHHAVHGHFWIPIDDENCWAWSFDYHPIRDLTPAELAAMRDGKGIHVRYVPGTYRPLANKDNDYLIDRAAQKAGRTFSGVEGIAMQDASLQESMGPIVDRTKENLVSTDNGIIMARHRLLRAVKALVDTQHHAARRRSRTPEGALRRHRAAAGCAVHGRCARGLDRPALRSIPRRCEARADMLSESARMSSAAEARFRVQAPNSTPRAITVIALDATERSGGPPPRRRRLAALDVSDRRVARRQPGGALRDLAGEARILVDEVGAADLIVFVAGPGGHAHAASPSARRAASSG